MATATVPLNLTEEEIEEFRSLLIEDDGEPLDTLWHRPAINLLIESVLWYWRGRTDFFVGGNMFIYYDLKQARRLYAGSRRTFRGPDFFMVNHVDGLRKRKFWWIVEENGRLPNAIVELSSPTTKKIDHTTKKNIYEREFKTPEYFCYDPDLQTLEGWRLARGRYRAIQPNERGWLWSEEFGLFLGTWEGIYLRQDDVWLRFYDAESNLVPTETETTRREKADKDRELVDKHRELADKHRELADKDRELAELKALLLQKGILPEHTKSKQKNGAKQPNGRQPRNGK